MNNTQTPKMVMPVPASESSNKWLYMIIVFVIGLVIGFFIGSRWQSKVENVEVVDDSTAITDQVGGESSVGVNGETPVNTTVLSGNAITVSDQRASTLVNVDSVDLKDIAWVAVREDNNGSLGRILGAQRLDAGSHTNVVISLLRTTEVGKAYYIVLYKDDGTKVFNYSAAGFIPGLSEKFTVFAAK